MGIGTITLAQKACIKTLVPPGLEPGTFRVLSERDNHYTTGLITDRENVRNINVISSYQNLKMANILCLKLITNGEVESALAEDREKQ